MSDPNDCGAKAEPCMYSKDAASAMGKPKGTAAGPTDGPTGSPTGAPTA